MQLIFKYIPLKVVLYIWFYKSAVVDYSKQRQAMFIISTFVFLPHNFILGVIYCIFWWFIHDIYFGVGRKLYLNELANANGLEVEDLSEIKCI